MVLQPRNDLPITHNGKPGSARNWQRPPPNQRTESGVLAPVWKKPRGPPRRERSSRITKPWEFAGIEDRIHEAEELLQAKRAALEDPVVTSDRVSLHDACSQLEAAEKSVDALYARWSELEQKQT